MKLSDIISPDAVAIASGVNSKKRALEDLSTLLAQQCEDTTARDIFGALINREKLGSTGLGSGVGIPHGRLGSATKAVGAILKLPSSIDFESVDREGVDLLFGLVVPKEATTEHLQILAGIADVCHNSELVDALRASTTAEELYALIADQTIGG